MMVLTRRSRGHSYSYGVMCIETEVRVKKAGEEAKKLRSRAARQVPKSLARDKQPPAESWTNPLTERATSSFTTTNTTNIADLNVISCN